MLKKNSGERQDKVAGWTFGGMNVLMGKVRLWGKVSDEMWDLTVAWGEGLQDHWLNQQGSELAAERAPAALSPLDSAIPSAQGTLCLWFPQSSLTALAPV